MVGLGDLPGGDFHSHASGVSADGSVIVGTGSSASGLEAVRWTSEGGMRSLRDVLVNDHGLDLTDWALKSATAISDDGMTIVGTGINPSGQSEAWRASLCNNHQVGLAWGVDVPVEYYNKTDGTGEEFTFRLGPDLTTPAATVDPATREDIGRRVQNMFSDSGVDCVSIVDGLVQEGTNVYFANSSGTSLLGQAFTVATTHGDRFNENKSDGVVVFLTGNTVLDASTAGHEVGHALGLRHVNPTTADDPSDLSLMDYDNLSGPGAKFINAVSEIVKFREDGPPIPTGQFHNPVYHLKRFVDLVDHDALVAQGIKACAPNKPCWDFPPDTTDSSRRVNVRLDFGGFDQGLFDVHILTGDAGWEEALTVLAAFDSISLSDLAQLSWELDEGTTFRLLAASTEGGDLDVILATGDPFDSSNRGVLSGNGEHATMLQLVTDPQGGYITLTSVTLAATLPNLSDLTGNGFVDFEDLTILLANWNKEVGADKGNLVNAAASVVDFADLTVLLADWTGPGAAGSPEAALGAEAVPEPSGLLLALIAALGLNGCCWRRKRTAT